MAIVEDTGRMWITGDDFDRVARIAASRNLTAYQWLAALIRLEAVKAQLPVDPPGGEV